MQELFLKFPRIIQGIPPVCAKIPRRYQHNSFFGNNPVDQFYRVKTTPALTASLEKASSLKEDL